MFSNSTPLTSNKSFLDKYLSLKQPNDKIQVTYVYEHPGNKGTGGQFHPQLSGKTRVVNFVPNDASELPVWTQGVPYSATIELFLKPVHLYNDPFRGGNNKLVLCEILSDDMKPHIINKRHSCVEAMKLANYQRPWFGFEQEYYLLEGWDIRQPLGWPVRGYPPPAFDPLVNYHSGIGPYRVCGRDIVEAHFRACLYAGVNISGENAEGALSQWEYQIGPSEGITIADDIIMSRYILYRVAEDLRVGVTFDPKPVAGWLGSGGHMNFSTDAMRSKGGLKHIERAIERLGKRHDYHMRQYAPYDGRDNEIRLRDAFYAPKSDGFTYGIGDRSASIRIPKQVAIDGYGYFEDRRPAANCNPYQVSEALVRTCCLNE
ncbi:glutamine synthetase-like [Oppia nitens]|uniref:glutamine synthetase-like n=1 Tax=Oppia nitens TaxID=1686743 RepID=UPI0023DCAE03|nr:glutamine synthetase-like [Oppia nitens]